MFFENYPENLNLNVVRQGYLNNSDTEHEENRKYQFIWIH